MHENEIMIEKYYKAFQNLDYRTMVECYHRDARFEDPVFGPLDAEETAAMWEMLCRNAHDFSLEYGGLFADEFHGQGQCVASYLFSKTGRRVVNRIESHFEFHEGKILRQRDRFGFWNWARQAFGIIGFILGWLPYFQRKVRREARKNLDRFMERKKEEGSKFI